MGGGEVARKCLYLKSKSRQLREEEAKVVIIRASWHVSWDQPAPGAVVSRRVPGDVVLVPGTQEHVTSHGKGRQIAGGTRVADQETLRWGIIHIIWVGPVPSRGS